MSFAGAGQPAEQHHGGRLVLQQLVRPRQPARRPHRRRADLARSDRADPGERRALRRAAGQLRRRRREHRHAQRHQPAHAARSTTGSATRSGRHRSRRPGRSIPARSTFRTPAAGRGGPIVKNKLFVVRQLRGREDKRPDHVPCQPGGEPVGGNITRVLASDLDGAQRLPEVQLRLRHRAVRGLPDETPAKRFLPQRLQPQQRTRSASATTSSTRAPTCSSNASIARLRQPPQHHQLLNFQNSNYQILENIRSGIGEWNSVIGSTMANSLIVGYTTRTRAAATRRRSSRSSTSSTAAASLLHVVRLRALHAEQRAALQHVPAAGQLHEVQQQAHADLRRHLRALPSENVFFPGIAERLRLQLARRLLHRRQRLPGQPEPHDLAGDAARVPGALHQHPGRTKPIQPLDVLYGGAYAQDEWRPGRT